MENFISGEISVENPSNGEILSKISNKKTSQEKPSREATSSDESENEPQTKLIMIKEIPNLKGAYHQIIDSTQEANNATMKALNLVKSLSSSIQDMSDELIQSFGEVSEPLLNTAKSISLSITALKSLGSKCIEIEMDNSEAEIENRDTVNKSTLAVNVDEKSKEDHVPKNDDSQKFIKEEESQVNNFLELGWEDANSNEHDHKNNIILKHDINEDGINDMDDQVHEIKWYKCKHCKFFINKLLVMKSHLRKKHNDTSTEYLVDYEDPGIRYFICPEHFCVFSSTDKSEWTSHSKEKHYKATLSEKDTIKERPSRKKQPIKKEKKETLEEESHQEIYSCDECDYSTRVKRYLTYHKETHTAGKYKCLYCNYVSHRPGIVKNHMKVNHDTDTKSVKFLHDREDPDIRYYLCSATFYKCNMVYTSQQELNAHVEKRHVVLDGDQMNVDQDDDWQQEEGDEHENGDFINEDDLDIKEEPLTLIRDHLDTDEHLSSKGKEEEIKEEFEPSNGDLEEDKKWDDVGHVKKYRKIHAKQKKRTRGDKTVAENSDVVEEADEDKVYQCTRCDYKINNKIFFNDHITGGQKFWKCPWCDVHTKKTAKTRKTAHLTTQHGIQKLGGRKMVCCFCEKTYPTTTKLLTHLSLIHATGTQHHCAQCDYSTLVRGNHYNHVKDHKVDNHPCQHCGIIFKNKIRLSKHVYQNHEEATCGKCDMQFKNRTTLFNHDLRAHTEQKDMFFCDECGKSFVSKGFLNLHMKNNHGNTELQCEQCEFSSLKPTVFRNHMLDKHGEFHKACDKCDYKSRSRTDYSNHQLKHKDKVTCSECGIKLGKYVLARHMKIKHSNLPPEFQCQEPGCNYATHEKITLKMHTEKVHENIRWPCDSCDYVGGYKADLNRHKKTVHEGFILQCPSCEYSTSKKYSLKEHLSKQHGVVEEAS